MATMADALALHREGKLDEAGALYDRILAVYPEQPDALHLKGVVLMQRGELREAVRLIGQAIILRPEDASFYSNLAAALYRLQMFDQAMQYALRSISLDAKSFQSRMVLAQCYEATRQWQEAADAYREALAIDPKNRNLIHGRLAALQALGNHDEVIEFIDSLSVPMDDRLRISRSQALRELKRFDEALSVMRECRAQSGHDWHVNMLKLMLERSDPEGAHRLQVARSRGHD